MAGPIDSMDTQFKPAQDGDIDLLFSGCHDARGKMRNRVKL
jgi:hypothetical protein